MDNQPNSSIPNFLTPDKLRELHLMKQSVISWQILLSQMNKDVSSLKSKIALLEIEKENLDNEIDVLVQEYDGWIHQRNNYPDPITSQEQQEEYRSNQINTISETIVEKSVEQLHLSEELVVSKQNLDELNVQQQETKQELLDTTRNVVNMINEIRRDGL